MLAGSLRGVRERWRWLRGYFCPRRGIGKDVDIVRRMRQRARGIVTVELNRSDFSGPLIRRYYCPVELRTI